MRRVLAVTAALAGLVVACGSEPGTLPVVTIATVLDGDSLRVVVDGETSEVRLIGVNAPERGECWGDESRTALTETVDAATAVEVTPIGEDRFGRLLAYVTADGVDVNLLLVENGDAVAMSRGHERRGHYIAAEARAVAAGRGMWANDACGPVVGGHGVRIGHVEYDAPGPDHLNPNGEWVLLVNEGGSGVLTGWGLRDESSVHRYRFPEGFVLPPGGEVRVRSGCGEDTETDLHWCADGPVWNNDGDTAMLVDPSGNIIDRVRYP